MLYSVYFLNIILFLCWASGSEKSSEESDNDDQLVTKLTNEANIDLPADAEYEDLRAELLAYHTALSSLAASRKSLGTTPCWQLGGICINAKLCTSFKFLTEVPGCKDKLNVCCFTWNRYQVKDMRDKGFGTLALPWQAVNYEFGGEGIKVVEPEEETTVKNKKKKKRIVEPMVLSLEK